MISKSTWGAIRLGLHIGVRARSWAQLMTIVAVAIAAMFLAIAIALPHTVAERGSRDLDRQPRLDFSAEESKPYVLVDTRLTLRNDQPVTEFFIAPGNSPLSEVPPPPGLDRLPRPEKFSHHRN